MDPVLDTVVCEGNEHFLRKRSAVETDAGNTVTDRVRILDGDPVARVAVTIDDLEAFPGSGASARVLNWIEQAEETEAPVSVAPPCECNERPI